jgi:hypothetical protein
MIDGGIMGPTALEAAVTAAANGAGYEASRIALISIRPSPAASATADPEQRRQYVHMREPATDMPQKLAREIENTVRDPAGVHQLAGQDEKRNGEQRYTVKTGEQPERQN